MTTEANLETPEAPKLNVRAVDVLREVMRFRHEQAKDVLSGIIVLLKQDPLPRGDLLANMFKEYARCADIAIDCAAKLAPYESPKLQSMEVKAETVHRFVVRTPAPALTTEEWMKNTGATHAEQKVIEPIHRVERSEDNTIEDAEIIEEAPDFEHIDIPDVLIKNQNYSTEF